MGHGASLLYVAPPGSLASPPPPGHRCMRTAFVSAVHRPPPSCTATARPPCPPMPPHASPMHRTTWAASSACSWPTASRTARSPCRSRSRCSTSGVGSGGVSGFFWGGDGDDEGVDVCSSGVQGLGGAPEAAFLPTPLLPLPGCLLTVKLPRLPPVSPSLPPPFAGNRIDYLPVGDDMLPIIYFVSAGCSGGACSSVAAAACGGTCSRQRRHGVRGSRLAAQRQAPASPRLPPSSAPP